MDPFFYVFILFFSSVGYLCWGIKGAVAGVALVSGLSLVVNMFNGDGK